jgi:hypothetical protein
MPYLIGFVLALTVGDYATAMRLDRDRAFCDRREHGRGLRGPCFATAQRARIPCAAACRDA